MMTQLAGDWSISKIMEHRKEGSRHEVKILWENGDTSWENMLMIKKEDPIALAVYAKESGLSHEPGWRWSRAITDRPKKYARMLKLMKNQAKRGPKIKFGIELPRNRKHARELDAMNGTQCGRMLNKRRLIN